MLRNIALILLLVVTFIGMAITQNIPTPQPSNTATLDWLSDISVSEYMATDVPVNFSPSSVILIDIMNIPDPEKASILLLVWGLELDPGENGIIDEIIYGEKIVGTDELPLQIFSNHQMTRVIIACLYFPRELANNPTTFDQFVIGGEWGTLNKAHPLLTNAVQTLERVDHNLPTWDLTQRHSEELADS